MRQGQPKEEAWHQVEGTDATKMDDDIGKYRQSTGDGRQPSGEASTLDGTSEPGLWRPTGVDAPGWLSVFDLPATHPMLDKHQDPTQRGQVTNGPSTLRQWQGDGTIRHQETRAH